MIESCGVPADQIFTAEEGVTALDMVYNKGIDLIISDWNMPLMDGITLLKNCKSDPAISDIPFIMLTSESEKEKVIEAVSEGVESYLIKPVKKEQILMKILSVFPE